MKELKEKILREKNWAVVGVTEDKERFAYKIWQELKKHDYKVYPINPKYSSLYGEKVYKDINEVEDEVKVVDLVVSPKIGIKLLDDFKAKGVEYVWLQPGSSSPELRDKMDKLGLKYLDGDCVYRTLINL